MGSKTVQITAFTAALHSQRM